jgi:transcriptional regulator with XRE-family HTH domain
MPPPTALGQLFVRERTKKGLTQQEAAKLARLSLRTITRAENGRAGTETISKLSQAYGLDARSLGRALKAQSTKGV